MKRRELVRGLASLFGAAAVGCEPDSAVMPAPPVTPMPPFSKAQLQSGLEALRAAYEARGHHVTPSLLPPLMEADLQRRCAWFPESLPNELLALYGWRGGQAGDAWEEAYPFWFRDCSFASPERAAHSYGLLMQSYGANPADHDLLAAAYPFAEFNGAWLVLPCRNSAFSGFSRPVISVHEGIEIWFYSITAMVDTCVDWVRHPEWVDGSLPRAIELEIWRRHNPGIFPGAD